MAQAHRIKTEPPAMRAGILRFVKGVLQESSFWLVVLIALGMIGALATFHVADPAWTHTANVAKIHNLVGTVGAWFADVSLYFFGYPAYWLPLGLLFAGWRLLKCGALLELDAEIVLFRVMGFAVALVTACGLAALHLKPGLGAVPGAGSAGGLVGVHVSRFLVQAFGFAWGNVLMIALLLAGVTLSTGFSWLKLVDWIGGTVLKSVDTVSGPAKAPRRRKASPAPPSEEDEFAESAKISPVADAKSAKSAKPAKGGTTAEKSGDGAQPPPAGWLRGAVASAWTGWQAREARRAATQAAPIVGDTPPSEPTANERPVSGSGAGAPGKSGRAARIEPVLDARRQGGTRQRPEAPANPSEAPKATLQQQDLTLIPTAVSPAAAVGRLKGKSAVAEAAIRAPWTTGADFGTEASNDVLSPVPRAKPRPAATPVAAGMARRAEQPQPLESAGLPPLALLDQPSPHTAGYSVETLDEMSRQVELLLKSFGVEARVVAVEPGPVITRFEVDPAPGVKVSQISNLAKDLARGLSVISVRVVEVIPGKSVIGLEIPNQHRETVYLREVLEAPVYTQSGAPLTLALGMDIGGNPVVANLAKMPHLLVAGTTGSGKSVAINAMLLSLLYKAPPAEVRLILVDPKMLELSMYEDIPHLLTPVVTDMKEAANALRWCVAEMERRYRLMAALKVRNIAGFNRKVLDALEEGEGLTDPLWKPDGPLAPPESPLLQPLPFIVVVIDELADMMMIVGKKVEELIARLAQKARASGIHLILATQRPSVDVITGLIKANIPTRVAFQVSSKVDSRTILDQMGAEQLLGHGDMLYLPPGTGLPQRVHGAFVDDQEVNRVVDFLRQTGAPDYIDEVLVESREESEFGEESENGGRGGESDPLYDEAVKIVTESRRASVSGVQRRLRIGYNRAARLVEEMEAAGVVGPLQSNGSREVLAPAPP